MIILGIDPGTAQTGFGIIDCSLTNKSPLKLTKEPTNGKNTKKEILRLEQITKRKRIDHCLKSSKINLITSGSIKTTTASDSPTRLNSIFEDTVSLIKKHKPEFLAIESLFFNSNAVSASAVGQAIGVIKLAAVKNKIIVIEYPPLKIKMKLLGDGRAEKKLVQVQVKQILKLDKIPRPTHAADALAAALCHWLEVAVIC